jgi:DNA-binding response OmpR family regulator
MKRLGDGTPCDRVVTRVRPGGHAGSLGWVVHALAESAEPDHIRVALVALVASPVMSVVEEALGSLVVSTGGAEVLERDPTAPVYLVGLDAALAPLLADSVVAWAQRGAHRPGVIGLVVEGGGKEREVLLAAGFDDVVAAPFSGRELAARVRAGHRRVHWKAASQGRLRYGIYTLDVYSHALWVDGRVVSLTSIELAVIRELVKARGRPLSRTDLLDTAWGESDLEVSERAVDNVILRLRRKLPRPEMIETVRGVGFRLSAEP